ncbi:hypothetical protein P389DRAFT_84649 [Cystobasidium minutum MCA 4210]|uniref:uncharacterized protein n=1 Tax=Cystobasidium minutum MCA 4210 TaxID=1397322 RepID=UPI0034CD9ADD|eukprot:jgi/Rhomi1/84649/CE84648_2196
MVYLRQWQDFAAGVRAMQDSGNRQAIRYCAKWQHSTGLLSLKVTDDQKCLQFRTRSAVFLNRFQVLTRHTIITMQSATARHKNEATPYGEVTAPTELSTTMQGMAGTLASSGPERPSDGQEGAKKKKPKKRKH